MRENQEWLVVGIIINPHGTAGKLNIKPLSDFEERFTLSGKRWLQKESEPPMAFELISGFKKPGKENFIICLKEINSRNEAEKFKKYKLLVKSSDIPELKKDEFHLSELLHLKVKMQINNSHKIIGEVSDLINEKNNLIVVKLYENDKNVLIPFVKEIIPIINKEEKFIVIRPPQGLLDL